ncbi:MAG: GNAT family N-acetyltransferase [Micropepsaceae bacterium]
MAMPYGLKPEQFDVTTVKGAVTVRPLTTADRDEWQRLWGLYIEFYRTSKPQAQYDLNWARLFDPDEPVFGYLAEVGGRPHGLVHIVMHRSFWLEGPSCYLQDLYADAELRGTGIGRALIEHVYRVVRGLGGERVHWLTEETNLTGQQLYDRIAKKSGFIQYVEAL